MANKQTRRLYKKQVSVKFNKGVDFAHLSGKERADHPEFTHVSFPFGKQPKKKKSQRGVRTVAPRILED